MNIADIIISALLVIGAWHGFRRGFVLEIIGIVAFVLAIVGGFKLLHVGMEYISRFYDGLGSFLPFISFMAIFILILFAVNALGKALKQIIDWTPLGFLDNIAGAGLGLLKWMLGLSVVLGVLASLKIDEYIPYLTESAIAPRIREFGAKVVEMINTVFPSFSDFIQSIKDLFEKFAS